MTRTEIAVRLLTQMILAGGTKESKVKAAFEYADLVLEEAKKPKQ